MLETIDLAADLVRIPSTSADVDGMRSVQQRVADVIRHHADDARVSTGGGDRPWTLISLGPDGPAPLFACHVDTVPVGAEAQWSRPPRGGEIDDSHLHGRGSVDMKGGLAAATTALLRASDRGAAGHLLLTSDEEIGSLGAQHTRDVITDLALTGIVIPEATSLTVRCTHRGALWLRLVARGRSSHGSAPERGINAVTRLASALGPALAAAPLRHDPALGAETASVGTFHGGDATNIVPDAAAATVDLRTIAEPEPLLEHWAGTEGIDEVETLLDLSALRTDPDSHFVRSLPAEVDPSPVTYFTDGSVLQQFRPDLPVVIWGPGDPAQMHSVDEHLELAQLLRAAELFEQVLVSGRR
ncbi:M20/M25/M40 family metallo-hydrolase [Brachybacterium sp. sponge]|uniref:M20/M25/M40 family metallo-hydrolase n=1 Tax=Brachybacterium sp. sponge TaxID=1775432 RepID=UPI0007A46E75|nr:M20/M25/M40 family metallo-hydrolase [Brachybacterium sp. sponge]